MILSKLNISTWIKVFGIISGFICILGCRGTTPPTLFYGLATLTERTNIPFKPFEMPGLAVGIGPLTLPKSIDRPHIVFRQGVIYTINEFHRWAGSLHSDMLRVLSDNLAYLLASNRIHPYPWANAISPEIQVLIDIIRFDGAPGASLHLNATYTLMALHPQPQRLLTQKHIAEIEIAGSDYTAFVDAASQLLENLSRAIAKDIRKAKE